MIYDAVCNFIKLCPFLEVEGVNINFLGSKPTSYTIEPMPNTPVIRKYVDGAELRQYDFVFASREYFGQDVINNGKITAFYEKLQEWIEKQSDIGNLPILEGKKQAQAIEVVAGGYLYDQTETTARYQIQCKLIYLKQEA